MGVDDEEGRRAPPLPTDEELEADLARIDPRHWDEVRRRVAALRAVLAGDGGSVARAADAIGVTTDRIYQLVVRWKETGSVANLGPRPIAARRLPDRLPSGTIFLLERVLADVLRADPGAGVERVAEELRVRCEAIGLTPPSGVTVRRRVERIVEDAGSWNLLASRVGAWDRLPAGIIVDRATLGLPWRAAPGDEPGLPIATLAVDRATGRIIAHALDARPTWAADAAAALAQAFADGTDRLPATVEADRDADPAWRAIDNALARAGIVPVTPRSPSPGTGRRLARAVGSRIAGIPLLTRGMSGDGRERLRRWKAGRSGAVEPADRIQVERVFTAAVAAHNEARPSFCEGEDASPMPDGPGRRTAVVAELLSVAIPN